MRFQERLAGNPTQAQNHHWLDELELLPKIRLAGFNFLRQRIPVIGWTAFKNVADKDFFPLELNRFKNFVKELAGSSYEWLTLCIFVSPRSFPYDDDIGARTTNAEDELDPG